MVTNSATVKTKSIILFPAHSPRNIIFDVTGHFVFISTTDVSYAYTPGIAEM